MKVYKITDRNTPYIHQSAFPFKSFEVTSGNAISKAIEYNIDSLYETGVEGWRLTKSQFGWPKGSYHRVFGLKMDVLTFQENVAQNYYYDSSNPKQYSKFKRTEKDQYREFFNFTGKNENNIRVFNSTDVFTYINFPNSFLKENLSRIICNANTQNFFKALEGYSATTVHDLIDLYDKYDDVYTDIEKYDGPNDSKPPYYYLWRRDLFFYMTYSLSKLGYYNPAISKKTGSLFFDGSHRLGVGTGLGLDYPIFIFLNDKNKISDGVYCTVTAGVCLNETPLLLEVNIPTKKIRGWEFSKEQIAEYCARFHNDPTQVYILKEPGKVKKYYQEFVQREPDILIET